MSTRVFGLTTTSPNIQMFPNGKAHDAGVSQDVWLGQCFIEKIVFSTTGAADETYMLQIYDGITLATLRPVIGGTAASPVLERWRVIAGAATSQSEQGEPYQLGGANAQVTAMRKLFNLNPKPIKIPTAGSISQVVVPINQRFPGAAVVITGGSGAQNSFAIHYIPYVNGATRRRLHYRPGSTVKVERVLNGDL